MSQVLLRFRDNDTFKVDVGFRDTALCKQVPGMRAGRLDVGTGEVEWTCPATWYHAVVCRAVFSDRLTYDDTVCRWGHLESLREQNRRATKDHVAADNHLGLYPFQTTGAGWLAHGNSILADDMGLGKTVQALAALNAVVSGDALVVTTSSMKFKWAEEAAIWAPAWTSVVVVDGSADKRSKAIEKAPPGTLFIINWESLRLHTRQSGYGSITLTPAERAEKELNRRNITVVIADEAHRAKDPKSKQARSLWQVAKSADYVWALTGTPVANVPNDLWSLLHLMDPVVWASRSAFQDRYVYGFTTDWGFEPIGWRAENKEELFRFVDQYMLRRSKAEVLPDLPAKTYETRTLDLTSKQAAAYRDLRKEMMTAVGGDLLTADNTLTQLIRLQQTASATPVVVDGEVIGLEKPSNKVAALLEILSEGDDEPVVVFAQSRKLIDLAEVELDSKGISSVRITGSEGSELRALNVQTFQEGRVRVALCTFGAGSEGITLTRASTAVFLQRPWSLVQSRQAEDRIHRIGQDADKVLIIDLVSKGTVDALVHEALVVKGENLESVVRDRERLAALL